MTWIDIFWATWWGKTLSFVTLAGFAGAVGHALRSIEQEAPLKFSRTALESGAAGFVGLLFKLVCDEMHASEQWTGVVVGLAGWLGASASVGVLEEFVYKRLGVNRLGKGEPRDGLDH